MKPFAIEQFASVPVDVGATGRALYGISPAKAVLALRDFARRVNREQLVVTSVTTRQTLSTEDICTKTLTITYVEAVESKKPEGA